MKHPLNTSGIRWLRRSQWVTRKLPYWIEAIRSGIFMGLIEDQSFQAFDTYPFDETKPLDVADETARGLEPWERRIVQEHLAGAKSILVVAAGGARELSGLQELGYDASGIEYGRQLCDASRQELALRACSATIRWCERFEVPGEDEPYDAAFVARKFLSHVHDRRRRIELLANIRRTLRPDATLVIAYYTRRRDTFGFRVQAALANILRRLRRRRDFPVEVGDHLDPEWPLYHHHYDWDELCGELLASGFHPVAHETTWFGWAVARPIPADDQPRSSSSDDRSLPEDASEMVETC